MRLLLDTCSFLWLAQQPSAISNTAAELINDPANTLLLSDVSLWEITLKHAAGKLPLPDRPRQWIPRKLEFHQVDTLEIDRESLFRCGELPDVHRDPFDRLLVAQGITHGLTLLSPDTPLSELGASRIW